MISKYGMSMAALGIAQEYKDKNILAILGEIPVMD